MGGSCGAGGTPFEHSFYLRAWGECSGVLWGNFFGMRASASTSYCGEDRCHTGLDLARDLFLWALLFWREDHPRYFARTVCCGIAGKRL